MVTQHILMLPCVVSSTISLVKKRILILVLLILFLLSYSFVFPDNGQFCLEFIIDTVAHAHAQFPSKLDMNKHIYHSYKNMSASPQQFEDSDSDTSCDPPTPTEGTTYVHNLNKRHHTRIEPRKRHAKTIYPPKHDLPINKEL